MGLRDMDLQSYFKAKPVKVGEELDVTMSDLSEGVTGVRGYVIFIPNWKQG